MSGKFIRKYINNASKPVILSIGFILILLVSSVDYITTNEVSFSIFYLIPIAFVTWYSGRYWGLVFSFLSGIVWYIVEVNTNVLYTDFMIPYWNTLVRLGFFIIVNLLLSSLKELKDNLQMMIKQRTAELENEIENHKKAKDELERNSSRLRELNKNIESIKEEQNTRIAREVHDELGQSLTAINLELMWISKKHSNEPDIVNRMSVLSEIVTDTIGTVRKISSDLRPRLLDQLGIVSAIESQLKDFSSRTGIPSELIAQDKNIHLKDNVSIMAFRIFQEAITNIARHSKAENVTVIIKQEKPDLLTINIDDDGIGFNVEKSIMNTGSLGLTGMKERASIINAELQINSSHSTGTEIILKIPLNNDHDKYTDS